MDTTWLTTLVQAGLVLVVIYYIILYMKSIVGDRIHIDLNSLIERFKHE